MDWKRISQSFHEEKLKVKERRKVRVGTYSSNSPMVIKPDVGDHNIKVSSTSQIRELITRSFGEQTLSTLLKNNRQDYYNMSFTHVQQLQESCYGNDHAE